MTLVFCFWGFFSLSLSGMQINKALPKEESRKRKTEEPGPSALKKAKTEPLLPEVMKQQHE